METFPMFVRLSNVNNYSIMKTSLTTIFLLISILCFTQLEDYYENGQIRTDATYINGALDGSYTFYHDNGEIYVQVDYRRGDLDGLITFYKPNGKVLEKVLYKDGVPVKKKSR